MSAAQASGSEGADRPGKRGVFPQLLQKPAPASTGKGTGSHGVTVPKCRKIAKTVRGMQPSEISKLLSSAMHEEREVALFILVDAFNHATSDKDRDDVYASAFATFAASTTGIGRTEAPRRRSAATSKTKTAHNSTIVS